MSDDIHKILEEVKNKNYELENKIDSFNNILKQEIDTLKQDIINSISDKIENYNESLEKRERNNIINRIFIFTGASMLIILLFLLIVATFQEFVPKLEILLWLSPIYFIILILCSFAAIFFLSKPED